MSSALRPCPSMTCPPGHLTAKPDLSGKSIRRTSSCCLDWLGRLKFEPKGGKGAVKSLIFSQCAFEGTTQALADGVEVGVWVGQFVDHGSAFTIDSWGGVLHMKALP